MVGGYTANIFVIFGGVFQEVIKAAKCYFQHPNILFGVIVYIGLEIVKKVNLSLSLEFIALFVLQK